MPATTSPIAGPPTAAGAAARSCPSCGSGFVGNFCGDCGEQQLSHRDLSVRHLIRLGLAEFTMVDGKVLRTLVALIRRPGQLTREFMDGRRGRYTKPFSLFVRLNLVFFLVQPHTGLLRYSYEDYVDGDGDRELARAALVREHLAKTHESESTYAVRFNDTLGEQKKSMLLFAVPLVAIGMGVLFAGSRRFFVEHLVFSVHAYAFLLVLLTAGLWLLFNSIAGWLFIADAVGVPIPVAERTLFGEAGVVTAVALPMTAYLAVAIRRAYGDRWLTAIPRGFAVAMLQLVLVIVSRDALFFTTFYST